MTPWVVAGLALAAAIVFGALWFRARQETSRLDACLRALQPDPPTSLEAARTLAAQQERDRSALWEALQRAQSEAALLQPLLGMLSQPSLLVDQDNHLLAWNSAAIALMQPNAVPRIGQRAQDVIRGFALIDALLQALETGEAQEFEGEVGSGRGPVYAIAVLPIETPAGRRAMAVLTDHSSTAAFRELRREFVTNVTHELKTPLTNIVGATETLLGGAMDDAEFRPKFLEIIQRNADQLRALIEDLLLIARSEEAVEGATAGEECEYRSVREMVLQDLHAAAEAAEVDLRAQPLSTGISLLIPAADCYTILKNLTENAIRYNKQGGVVEFSERHLEHQLEISVRDTGIGIPPGDLPRVFERFYRADKQRSRAIGGTGLGLAIVKNLVENHGGTVDVMSKPGLGSTFVVLLPLAESVQPALATAAE